MDANGGSVRKKTDRKKAQRLADEYEKASRTKRSLRQAQAVSVGREALQRAAASLPDVVEFHRDL
jgi:predicted secreted protein